MKRFCIFLLLTVLLLASLPACEQKEKPGLSNEEAQQILAPLLPVSTELMQLFFGEGLKYEEPESIMEYDGAQYEPVLDGQAFASIAEMKQAMEGIYSSAYRRDLNILMFEGYETPKETEKDEEVISGSILPRYIEEKGVLKIDIKYEVLPITLTLRAEGARVLDGNATRVIVAVPYTDKDGNEKTMRINLALENGKWLLDGPTY